MQTRRSWWRHFRSKCKDYDVVNFEVASFSSFWDIPPKIVSWRWTLTIALSENAFAFHLKINQSSVMFYLVWIAVNQFLKFQNRMFIVWEMNVWDFTTVSNHFSSDKWPNSNEDANVSLATKFMSVYQSIWKLVSTTQPNQLSINHLINELEEKMSNTTTESHNCCANVVICNIAGMLIM